MMGFIKYKSPDYTIIRENAFGTGTVVDADRFNDWTGNPVGNTNHFENEFVLPDDSPNFEGDNGGSGMDRQDFFRWAYQTFYWILSPSPNNYAINGEGCNSLVLNSPEFFDVNSIQSTYKRHKCNVSHTNGQFELLKHKNVINVGENMSFDVKGTNKGKHKLPLVFEEKTDSIFELDKTPKSDKGYSLIRDEHGNHVEVGEVKRVGNNIVFYDRDGNKIKYPTLILSISNLDPRNTVQEFLVNQEHLFINTSTIEPIVINTNIGQAGSGAVLMAQNNSLVYYNIMVNDVYVAFSEMVKNGVLPQNSKFPTTVTELNAIKAYGASHGIPIVDTNNHVLALELKTSWVEDVNGLPNSNRYVKIRATVPKFIQGTTANTWIQSGTRSVVLSLVGMHVVGSVKGHPEMIWSTFEHKNNTPNAKYAFTTNGTGDGIVPTDVGNTEVGFPNDRSGSFLFCENIPTTPFNIPHIVGSVDYTAIDPFRISPSNTIRQQPFGWGGVVAPNEDGIITNLPDILNVDDSNAQLVAINTDIKNNLVGEDVRKNYFEVGAMWSSLLRNNQQAGTVRLSNSTMETYTQATNFKVIFSIFDKPTNSTIYFSGAPVNSEDGLNCFSCHDAGFGPPSTDPQPINPVPNDNFLSHVFRFNIVQRK